MSKHGKRYQEASKLVERGRTYEPAEAVALLKETATVKFEPSVEAHIRLGVDPRHADQMVRGTVTLPHGTGKEVRVAVFAQGDKAVEATAAGADVVGAEDLAARIEAGWLEFDVAVATPDMMGSVGKLGRILGRRGLMPNPKAGTVTFDLERVINELKGGRIEFKVDKGGIIHVAFGKASFEPDAAHRQPGRPDRRHQPRPAQGSQGPVLQEPHGRLHHGPGHPRRCPEPAGPGGGLTAAGRAARDKHDDRVGRPGHPGDRSARDSDASAGILRDAAP